MLINIFYFILAALALSFLVFIHELGHYLVARKVGMRVEVFSIGFGKPFYTWNHKGVKWQICYLLFGGYVKISGMEREGDVEPHDVPEGFYGKKPSKRIAVALMGPITNIVFALLVFCAIWAFGGRVKPFSEFTQVIGSMDETSQLYEMGVEPGDLITQIGDKPYEGFRDLLYAGVIKKPSFDVQGEKIDYFTMEKQPFNYAIKPYMVSNGAKFKSLGILSPASYLLYSTQPDGQPNPLPAGSALEGSGIEYGDRIVWVQGELIFSLSQLMQVINEDTTLFTVRRGTKTFLTKLPRIKLGDLRLRTSQLAEFRDWKYAENLEGSLNDLFFIPYSLSNTNQVESELAYLDDLSEEHFFYEKAQGSFEIPLKRGDQILALDGIPLSSTFDLFQSVQKRHLMIIVEKYGSKVPSSWRGEDQRFLDSANWQKLSKLIDQIGLTSSVIPSGNFRMLKPVIPKSYEEIFPSQDGNRSDALMLGIALQDQRVVYNPSPFILFGGVLDETWRTLKALVTGSLNPKWLSGPVGIVHVLQISYQIGIKEMLFWLGVISLNLGILNLLPIPVLDGGHICFSLYEAITKKRIKAKTMERLIIPFIILLIGFFIFATYQDVLRLFTN